MICREYKGICKSLKGMVGQTRVQDEHRDSNDWQVDILGTWRFPEEPISLDGLHRSSTQLSVAFRHLL